MQRIVGNHGHKANSLVLKQLSCSSTVLGQIKGLHLLGHWILVNVVICTCCQFRWQVPALGCSATDRAACWHLRSTGCSYMRFQQWP